MKTPAKQAAAPTTGTAVVTVALKHPTGIVIEAFEKMKSHEPVMGGGTREVTMYRSTGKQFPINGNRVPFGSRPNFDIIGGYAMTPGIPKEVWEIWLEQHQDHPLVVNELITAHDKIDMAEDFARDHKSTRSGLEPLLRKGDPRADKKKNRDGKFVDAIETADEQPAAAS